MSKRPWFKFYPSDWQGDLRLRSCSVAARGLWAELICIMNSADPKGHLRVNGSKPNNGMLSTLCGVTENEVKKHLNELENAGVFSRANDGTIFSRRMVREAEKAKKNRENGAKGGNPALMSSVNPSDIPPDNPEVKGGVKAHIPDTRYHIPEVPFRTNQETDTEVISNSVGGAV